MSRLDELMALVEEYAGACSFKAPYGDVSRSHGAVKSALKAVLEDAERYQIWKDAYTSEEDDPTPVMAAINNAWTPKELDAAIDAARKA